MFAFSSTVIRQVDPEDQGAPTFSGTQSFDLEVFGLLPIKGSPSSLGGRSQADFRAFRKKRGIEALCISSTQFLLRPSHPFVHAPAFLDRGAVPMTRVRTVEHHADLIGCAGSDGHFLTGLAYGLYIEMGNGKPSCRQSLGDRNRYCASPLWRGVDS
jgi:hypothetical protein